MINPRAGPRLLRLTGRGRLRLANRGVPSSHSSDPAVAARVVRDADCCDTEGRVIDWLFNDDRIGPVRLACLFAPDFFSNSPHVDVMKRVVALLSSLAALVDELSIVNTSPSLHRATLFAHTVHIAPGGM